jgi:hypothetical protein
MDAAPLSFPPVPPPSPQNPQLRGALRGAAAPVPLAALSKELGLDAAGAGGGGRGMVGGLIEELIAEGAAAGTLKGGGQGGVWTPAVYASAQGAAVKGFYSQNGWVSYDTARRMGVANDRAYLASAFPDGIALETGEEGGSVWADGWHGMWRHGGRGGVPAVGAQPCEAAHRRRVGASAAPPRPLTSPSPRFA